MPFFTGLAQLSKATDKEMEEAIQVASVVGRDSVYLAGIDYDEARFRKELQQVAAHAQKAAKK